MRKRTVSYILKDVGLKEQKLATFDNVSFLACKIISFQNDNAIFVNRQEITFFGAQKGLWDGRRGSDFLIFRKNYESNALNEL